MGTCNPDLNALGVPPIGRSSWRLQRDAAEAGQVRFILADPVIRHLTLVWAQGTLQPVQCVDWGVVWRR